MYRHFTAVGGDIVLDQQRKNRVAVGNIFVILSVIVVIIRCVTQQKFAFRNTIDLVDTSILIPIACDSQTHAILERIR